VEMLRPCHAAGREGRAKPRVSPEGAEPTRSDRRRSAPQQPPGTRSSVQRAKWSRKEGGRLFESQRRESSEACRGAARFSFVRMQRMVVRGRRMAEEARKEMFIEIKGAQEYRRKNRRREQKVTGAIHGSAPSRQQKRDRREGHAQCQIAKSARDSRQTAALPLGVVRICSRPGSHSSAASCLRCYRTRHTSSRPHAVASPPPQHASRRHATTPNHIVSPAPIASRLTSSFAHQYPCPPALPTLIFSSAAFQPREKRTKREGAG